MRTGRRLMPQTKFERKKACLARLELRVLLQELIKRVDRIEQTGEHAFLRSNFVCGIKRLPVRMHLI